jgi:hypothetical protein
LNLVVNHIFVIDLDWIEQQPAITPFLDEKLLLVHHGCTTVDRANVEQILNGKQTEILVM